MYNINKYNIINYTFFYNLPSKIANNKYIKKSNIFFLKKYITNQLLLKKYYRFKIINSLYYFSFNFIKWYKKKNIYNYYFNIFIKN
jgi:hypothetical protein